MKDIAANLILAAFLLIVFVNAMLNPIYTWDAVPYVATTLEVEIDDDVALESKPQWWRRDDAFEASG